MQPDILGFMYPKIDDSKCVSCGLCESICSFNAHYDCSQNLKHPDFWAVRHKDIEQVMKSRSGGAFAAISDGVLEQGGVVYGAGYGNHFRVVHKRAETKEQRDEFRGSKYVQSDLSGIFQEVKKDLMNDIPVLFSGTPCQTAGLSSFIGEKLRSKLVLVDIVCHGVPSPYVWRDYLSFIEKKYGDNIKHVDFRNKKQYGWNDHRETYEFSKMTISRYEYTDLFYCGLILRKCCCFCPFTNLNRPSDITLADFWGWEKSVPSINIDNRGVSLVLCSTPKGRFILDNVKENLIVHSVNVQDCLQPNLQYPTARNPKRDKFEKYYEQRGFKQTMDRFGFMGWRHSVKKKWWWMYCRLRELKNRMLSFYANK